MRVILTALAFCGMLAAQTNYGNTNGAWQVALSVLPSSATAVVSSTVTVEKILLANTSAAAVTVTVTDASTNCGGTVCQILPTVSIAANSVYVIDALGVTAVGGVKWNASSSTAVHGWMRGKY